MNHTPDKWVLDEDGEPFIYQLNGAGTNLFSFNVQGGNVDTGERTSKEQCRAIAEFIYTACNAHEELVALLEDAATGRHAISPDWYARASALVAALKKEPR